MQGRTFEVQFTPIDQQTPSTSSVPGQMRFIRNGQVTQFDDKSIKIGKRDGFRQITKNVRDVTDGSSIGSSGFPATPSLFSSLGDEQVIVSKSHPYVLAENEPAWSKFPYVYSPTVVTQRPFYTANTQILNPDGASVGAVFCRTWSEVVPNNSNFALRISFTDSDGAPIVEPRTIITDENCRAKVVSDGTYFWVVLSFGDTLYTEVYNTNGQRLAFLSFHSMRDSSLPWDVTFQGGKVMVLHETPSSSDCIGVDTLTFNGIATITNSFATLGFTALGNLGCAWAENTSGDGLVYFMTAHYDPDGYLPVERAFQLDVSAAPTITHYYGIGNNSGSTVYVDDGFGVNTGLLTEMTGVNTADGFYIQLSFVEGDGTSRNFSPDHKLVRMVMILASLASEIPPVQRVLTSVVSASRTFQIDGRNVGCVYYASGQPTIIVGDKRYSAEPTYFLIDIVTGQVCGEFNWSSAAMEWSRVNYPTVVDGEQYGPFNFCVGHIFSNFLTGDVHLSVAYQAQSVNKVVPTNDIFGPAVRLTSTVGFEDIKLGGEGQSTEYASELLMPGPLATSFTGYGFGENNLTLAPEQPVLAVGTGSGDRLTLNGLYSYILVFERTLPNGDRVRSAVSIPQTIQLAGSQNEVTISMFPLFMTSYSDVIISIYRNIMDSLGNPGTIHYKITDDLAPLFNSKTVHLMQFTDSVTDLVASVNEILYTDRGFVNRIPCPPFSVGCVFENRIIVYGLDGAIWFSGEKSEGEAIWFSDDPSFRVAMPTNDPVKNLLPVDGRVGILCANSEYAFTGGGFPGPDGLGANLQTPQRLPFNQGSTGYSEVFPLGAVYSSSAGDAWVFTRGLENKHLGEKAVADFANRGIVGICIDKKQRIGFALAVSDDAASGFEVYDQVAQLWLTYLLPTSAKKAHTMRGNMAYADSNSVWRQDDNVPVDTFVDATTVVIPQSFQTEFINIGAVKNFQRIWNQIITGEYNGPHTLNVTTVADSNGTEIPTKYSFAPSSGIPYCYSLPPAEEEVSRVSFLFEDSDIEGDTFAIELISFYVAVADGLTRLPPSRQFAPTLVPVSGTINGTSDRSTVLRLNGAQDLTVLPGATTFEFPIGAPLGQRFTITKKSGPGTVVNPSGMANDPQTDIPILSL